MEKTLWESVKTIVVNKWDKIFTRPILNLHYIYEKITGTWEYLCFIWKSNAYREWDFEYLYDLIEFKLKRMALQLRKDNYVTESETTYQEILQCLAYLHVYRTIEDGEYDHKDPDAVKDMYQKQQDAWENFHDWLKEHAQKWWS